MIHIRPLMSVFKMQMKLSLDRTMFRMCILVQPLIYCFLLYYVYLNSNRNMTVIIFSSMLITLWSCLCFSSLGDIQRERNMGTFNYIYCCPVSFISIIIVKTLTNTVLGFSSIIVISLVSKFILGVELYIQNPLYFTLSVGLIIISFLSLSLLISSFFLLSRDNLGWVNLLQYPLYICCGMIVPVTTFPQYISYFCYVFPPTKAIEIFNESIVSKNLMYSFWIDSSTNIIHSIIFIVIGTIIVKKLDRKMRIDNTGGLM